MLYVKPLDINIFYDIFINIFHDCVFILLYEILYLHIPGPSYLFLLRARVIEEVIEKKVCNNWFYYGTTRDVHINLLCASAHFTITLFV
jgi:hypothetical protein